AAARVNLWSLERLDAAGYRQYEISNVARPGRESRHNLKYWQDGEGIWFGWGGHSTMEGAGSRNVAGTEDYIARVRSGQSATLERRELTREERLEDALFTGPRVSGGVGIEGGGGRGG